jgi:hypothetical protein
MDVKKYHAIFGYIKFKVYPDFQEKDANKRKASKAAIRRKSKNFVVKDDALYRAVAGNCGEPALRKVVKKPQILSNLSSLHDHHVEGKVLWKKCVLVSPNIWWGAKKTITYLVGCKISSEITHGDVRSPRR